MNADQYEHAGYTVTINSYLTGKCHGFVISGAEGDLESCRGIIGNIDFCREQASATVDWLAREQSKADRVLLNRAIV